MKINKSTWHYRLLNKLDLLAWRHETLCKYFWKVVFAAVLVPLIAVGAAIIGSIPFWWYLEDGLFVVACLVAAIEVVLLTCLLGATIGARWEREIAAGTRQERVYVYKEPSLFRKWLTAKHEQVCPIIDFVDNS